MSRVWTDTAVLAYVERSPGLKRPSGFYTYWQQNNIGNPFTVKKFRDEKIDADRIEVRSIFDNLVPASDCVYLFINTMQ